MSASARAAKGLDEAGVSVAMNPSFQPFVGTFGAASDEPLVFVPSESRLGSTPAQRKLVKWLPWLLVCFFASLPFIISALLADRAGGGVEGYLKAFDAVVLKQPELWLKFGGQMLALVVGVWLVTKLMARGRLELTHGTLRYCSNVPGIARLVDWHLNLKDLRSGAIQFKWGLQFNGMANPPSMRLSWRSGVRYITPANWSIAGHDSPQLRTPVRTYGFVSWKSVENQEILRYNVMAQPLTVALLALDVPLPPFTGRRSGGLGLELINYPRIRKTLGALAALAALGPALYVWTTADVFVTPVAPWWYGCVGAIAAGTAWLWMRPDRPLPDEKAAFPYELEVAKVVCALMIGAALAFAMTQAPLAWARAMAPEQEVRYVVRRAPQPHLEPAVSDTDAPVIASWPLGDRISAAMKEGGEFDLGLRRGFRGWWWQYDASPLLEAARVHYQKPSNAKPKLPTS